MKIRHRRQQHISMYSQMAPRKVEKAKRLPLLSFQRVIVFEQLKLCHVIKSYKLHFNSVSCRCCCSRLLLLFFSCAFALSSYQTLTAIGNAQLVVIGNKMFASLRITKLHSPLSSFLVFFCSCFRRMRSEKLQNYRAWAFPRCILGNVECVSSFPKFVPPTSKKKKKCCKTKEPKRLPLNTLEMITIVSSYTLFEFERKDGKYMVTNFGTKKKRHITHRNEKLLQRIFINKSTIIDKKS